MKNKEYNGYTFKCAECDNVYPLEFHTEGEICEFCLEEYENFFVLECEVCGETSDCQEMYHIEEEEKDVCGNCLGGESANE